jgi:hypothetical protein
VNVLINITVIRSSRRQNPSEDGDFLHKMGSLKIIYKKLAKETVRITSCSKIQ